MRASACLILFSVTGAMASAAEFDVSFNLRDDHQQYLDSFSDAVVWHESIIPGTIYWRPEHEDVWGEIVYRFPFGQPIRDAELRANLACFCGGGGEPNFDSGAQAHLDVSTDGTAWTTIVSLTQGNGGLSSSFGGDITPIVAGSDEAFVRARLLGTRSHFSEGPIYAQFVRTARSDVAGGRPQFVLTGTTVPEPATSIYLLLALFSLALGRWLHDASSHGPFSWFRPCARKRINRARHH